MTIGQSPPPAALPAPTQEEAPDAPYLAALSPEDRDMIRRIESLPPEVAWLLLYIGVLGFIIPGVLGLPFFIAGAAVLTPTGRVRFARWAARGSRPIVHAGLRQVVRMMDDLDRRYPPLPRKPR